MRTTHNDDTTHGEDDERHDAWRHKLIMPRGRRHEAEEEEEEETTRGGGRDDTRRRRRRRHDDEEEEEEEDTTRGGGRGDAWPSRTQRQTSRTRRLADDSEQRPTTANPTRPTRMQPSRRNTNPGMVNPTQR